MKIEIGESLAYSWLKHIKHCQIVQQNWKIADEWEKFHTDSLETMLEKAKEVFTADTDEEESSDEKSNIFKKNANLEQIIRQFESDVLGIHLSEDGKNEVYAVEVAFHSQGLNYTGGKQASKSKIIAKAIKSAMGIYTVLGAQKASICFISPKVNPATLDILKDVEEKLNGYFHSVGLDYKFATYFNEKFSNEVWIPVCNTVNANGANDTSELCARAMALQQLADASGAKVVTLPKRNVTKTTSQEGHPTNEDSAKAVGQIARNELRSKLEHISLDEAKLFTTRNYTQKFFNLSYSLLCEHRGTDAAGRPKYYADPVVIQGHIFYITNDWYERHKEDLINWIAAH